MFDAITIFRDSQPIATIAGDRESFTDDSRSGQRALYTVITELEGFRSPEVHCLDPAVWITEIGDVQLPVDAELVRVPVYLTTSEPSRGWDAFLEVPNDRLAIVRSLGPIFADTVWIHDPEFVGVGVSGATGFPAAGVLYDNLPPNQPEKDLPAGLRQYVLNFVFRPLGEFADGEVIDVKLLTASFSVRTESTTVSVAPDALIPGQIRFGTAGPAPVEQLAAAALAAADGAGAGGDGDAGGVLLAWRNADVYELLRIERNGELIAEIDGSATRFHDVTAPGGVFTYKVSGSRDGQSSFPASAFVSTIMPRGAFLRGDANRDGRVNLSDAVATLNYLFLGGARLPCDDAADADDDGALRITDPILTLNYLFLGSDVMKAPGTRYAWFDPSADNLTCRE